MQIHRNTHILAHTFPGGDESCQELAEVGSGVCIFLTQRKSFQLGGRAPVLDVGIVQGEGVSLEDSCSTQTETHKQQMILKLAAGLKKGLAGLLGTTYLQREQRRRAGPPQGAGTRTGAQDSSYTGLPARHTHTALQSSERKRE